MLKKLVPHRQVKLSIHIRTGPYRWTIRKVRQDQCAYCTHRQRNLLFKVIMMLNVFSNIKPTFNCNWNYGVYSLTTAAAYRHYCLQKLTLKSCADWVTNSVAHNIHEYGPDLDWYCRQVQHLGDETMGNILLQYIDI